MSDALKASTNRLAGAPASSAPASASAASPAASSTGSIMPQSPTMGSDGIGTTSSQLSGGSGGPPGIGSSTAGPGDFSLVLLKVVPPGSHVKKGQEIAEFDRQYMLLRLDDYRASLVIAENNMHVEEAQIAVARKAHDQLVASAKGDLDKARLDMEKIPVLSAIDTERTKLALAEADDRYKQLLAEVPYVDASEKAQIRNDRINLQETQIEFKRAETNAGKLVVKAPIDGLTVMENTWRGDQLGAIQAGDQLFSGQPFLSVVDPASILVNSRVNQVDAQRLRIGAKARIRFDAYPDLELPGHVYSIASMPKPGTFRASFVAEIPVRIKLDRLDPRVIPDLSVSADIVLAAEPKTTIAPLAAIFRDPGSRDSKPYVFLRGPAGWTRTEVELGLASNVAVSVRSGVKPGDRVALDPPRGPNSSAVEVRN
ncbi:MAG: HlyD family efflux transporter periplasmic adaptor subunit [Bryobacteraceae bacterium]